MRLYCILSGHNRCCSHTSGFLKPLVWNKNVWWIVLPETQAHLFGSSLSFSSHLGSCQFLFFLCSVSTIFPPCPNCYMLIPILISSVSYSLWPSQQYPNATNESVFLSCSECVSSPLHRFSSSRCPSRLSWSFFFSFSSFISFSLAPSFSCCYPLVPQSWKFHFSPPTQQSMLFPTFVFFHMSGTTSPSF